MTSLVWQNGDLKSTYFLVKFPYCRSLLIFVLSYFWKSSKFNTVNGAYKNVFCAPFCFEDHFVLRTSKVRKLVRANQFQVKSTKIGAVQNFVTLQYAIFFMFLPFLFLSVFFPSPSLFSLSLSQALSLSLSLSLPVLLASLLTLLFSLPHYLALSYFHPSFPLPLSLPFFFRFCLCSGSTYVSLVSVHSVVCALYVMFHHCVFSIKLFAVVHNKKFFMLSLLFICSICLEIGQ